MIRVKKLIDFCCIFSSNKSFAASSARYTKTINFDKIVPPPKQATLFLFMRKYFLYSIRSKEAVHSRLRGKRSTSGDFYVPFTRIFLFFLDEQQMKEGKCLRRRPSRADILSPYHTDRRIVPPLLNIVLRYSHVSRDWCDWRTRYRNYLRHYKLSSPASVSLVVLFFFSVSYLSPGKVFAFFTRELPHVTLLNFLSPATSYKKE